MCSVYQMQFPILHAKLMIIGLYITLYTSTVWGFSIVSLGRGEGLVKIDANYAVILDYLILIYPIFMLKGVSINSIKNIYLIMVIYFLIIYF